jgi:uncharacterized RDD family membrane protein YckC
MSGGSLTQPGGIVTPEAVVLEFETAGVGSRAAGEVLDVALQYLVLGLLLGAVAAASPYAGGTAAVVIGLIMTLLILIGYPVASETLWNGRTLGKAALGLRVVTVEGGPIRFRHAAIRGIIGFFEIYATFGSVALLVMLFSSRDQRLGDHVAGTIGLRERNAPGSQAAAVVFPPPYGMEPYVASLDVVALSAAQYGLIRSFLLRVLDLSPEARWSVSVKLANDTATALRLTPPPGVYPELFLACVASAYQRGHAPNPASYPPPRPDAAAPLPAPPAPPPPPATPAPATWAPPVTQPAPPGTWAPPPVTQPAPPGPPSGPPGAGPEPVPAGETPPDRFPWDAPTSAPPPGWGGSGPDDSRRG